MHLARLPVRELHCDLVMVDSCNNSWLGQWALTRRPTSRPMRSVVAHQDSVSHFDLLAVPRAVREVGAPHGSLSLRLQYSMPDLFVRLEDEPSSL